MLLQLGKLREELLLSLFTDSLSSVLHLHNRKLLCDELLVFSLGVERLVFLFSFHALGQVFQPEGQCSLLCVLEGVTRQIHKDLLNPVLVRVNFLNGKVTGGDNELNSNLLVLS